MTAGRRGVPGSAANTGGDVSVSEHWAGALCLQITAGVKGAGRTSSLAVNGVWILTSFSLRRRRKCACVRLCVHVRAHIYSFLTLNKPLTEMQPIVPSQPKRSFTSEHFCSKRRMSWKRQSQ